MLKWLGKLVSYGRRSLQGYVVYDYGQYLYKPVVPRAVAEVIGISQTELRSWIDDSEIEIYLNRDLIQGVRWAGARLESGNYEIKIPSQKKLWTFFIA